MTHVSCSLIAQVMKVNQDPTATLETVWTVGEGSFFFQYDPNLASISQCHLKMIFSIPRAKDATEAVSNIQKHEEYIRKYEKNRDRELDEK